MKVTAENLIDKEKDQICRTYLEKKTINDTAKHLQYCRKVVRAVLVERNLMKRHGSSDRTKRAKRKEVKPKAKTTFSSVGDVMKDCVHNLNPQHKKIASLMRPTN